MNKNNDFDCVRMKDKIQKQLAEEYAGLTTLERLKKIKSKLIESNDKVGKKWKAIISSEKFSINSKYL